MNKKILPLLVCLLFFIPIFSVIGAPIQIRNEEIPSDNYVENEPLERKYGNMSIYLRPRLGFRGVRIIIRNSGTEPLTDIKWKFNTSGGLFIRGGVGFGKKAVIKPNRWATVRLLPIPLFRSSSPTGIGRVEIEATAEASNGEFARTTADAIVIFRKTIFFRDQGNTVIYNVTFNATWSEETHPDDFPTNAHWSGLIGASHNDKVHFWRLDERSTPGIKAMAETGSKSPLDREIRRVIIARKAFKLISENGISTSPGSINLTFEVSDRYPLVTLVSMIAPSPDWFVGVDSLNLYENGKFVDEKTEVLYAHDAGTDSGTSYTAPNNPTKPPEQIFVIEGDPFFYEGEMTPVGTFTFTKI